jgi:hypothetical protein
MASRRFVACGAGLPLASLRFSPPHKSPPPGTARRAAPLVVRIGKDLGVSAKPWAGVRRLRHLRRRAPQSAWPRARRARFNI